MYEYNYSVDEGWPSARQELFLKIAMKNPEEAYEIWQENKQCLSLTNEKVSSRFILPQVYQNLMKFHFAMDTSILNYYRRLYLRTHLDNARHLKTISELSAAFNDAGLQLTLLKGSAMLLLYYKKPGLRPMSDIDIYIPSNKIETTLSLLDSMGWRPYEGVPKLTSAYMRWNHGLEFHNNKGEYIDLHWHILTQCCISESDNALRRGMVEIEYNGLKFLTLNPADQLLNTFDQNARCEGYVYLRWAADAARIIQYPGIDIDWRRLIRLSDKFRLVLPVRNGLTYLKERIGVHMPENVISELNRLPVSKMEHFEYSYKRRRIDNRLFSYWPVLWFDYSRRLRDATFLRKVIGFPAFLKEYWRIENVAVLLKLLREMAGKMLHARKL